jgi:hypothetical protein
MFAIHQSRPFTKTLSYSTRDVLWSSDDLVRHAQPPVGEIDKGHTLVRTVARPFATATRQRSQRSHLPETLATLSTVSNTLRSAPSRLGGDVF